MSFFRRFFHTRSKPSIAPIAPLPESPEDWQVGDIAECIHSSNWLSFDGRIATPATGPGLGDRHCVKAVKRRNVGEHEFLCLRFAAWPENLFYHAHFRKVRPQADETIAADTAFADQLRWLPQRLPQIPARELEEVS